MGKITNKIVVTLGKAQIKQHLREFFNIYKGMRVSWEKSGRQCPFEDFIDSAYVEFKTDYNSVIKKMMS